MKLSRSLFTFSKFYIPPFLAIKNLHNFQITEAAYYRDDLPGLLSAKAKETFSILLKYDLLLCFCQ